MVYKTNIIHPGEILEEEFLKPLGLSQYRLAKEINVPARRINEIVHGTRSISADTALRLSHFFKLSPQFWLRLQARYDIDIACHEAGTIIKRTITPYATAAER